MPGSATSRVPRAAAILAAGAVLGATVVAPASAIASTDSQQRATSEQIPSSDSWQASDESVERKPSKLTADLTKTEPAQVVAVREQDGRPVFDAVAVTGKAQAKAVIKSEQAQPETIAIAVEKREQFIAATAASTGPDPYRDQQWALNRLNAPAAWSITRGAGQTVAIVDTGVSAEPDFSGRLAKGWDFVADRSDGRGDDNGHGTHVAGIVGAGEGDGIGVAGLAPDVNLLPVKVLDAQGRGYWSDIAQGIVYSADNGASVINLSLGGSEPNSAVSTAIEYATAQGRTIVAASGNSGSTASSYPAADNRVIAAGASTQSDSVASFSNYGPYLDVVAPGVGIMSTLPGSFGSESGTSMAAPYVSATAALVRAAAVQRGLGTVDVPGAIAQGAADIDAPGRDIRSGAGRIDSLASLCAVGACSDTPITVTQKQVTPTVQMLGRTLEVRLNEPGVRQVTLSQKLTKKAAKKRFAKGKSTSKKRGPWLVTVATATSPSGETSFKLRKRYVYRVVAEQTDSSPRWKSAKISFRK